MQKLKREIEQKRIEMYHVVNHQGYQTEEVLKTSKELDNLLNLYHQTKEKEFKI